MSNASYSLTIGWLYPDLMSTYGDRGNILVLQKRATWRNIKTTILPITTDTSLESLNDIDLIFGGGSQDREQEIVMRDLKGKKGNKLKELIEKDIPALFVCGSPQIMGKWYEPAVGKKIEGIGVFDMETSNPGPDAERLIGGIVAEVQWQNFTNPPPSSTVRSSQAVSRSVPPDIIVGFENHGGRTQLGKTVKPFAKVIKGFGNNGIDGTEGVVYNNAVGCYLHGPLLPKNPLIADWLLHTALLVKYHENIPLKPLDDSIELEAQRVMPKG